MLKTLSLTLSILIASHASASCLPQYKETLKIRHEKLKIFKKSNVNGEGVLKGLAKTLGATAIGVTAGGAVGFVLPYAITGVTYAAAGVGTAATATVLTVPTSLFLRFMAPNQMLPAVMGLVIDGIFIGDGGNYLSDSPHRKILNSIIGKSSKAMFKGASAVGNALIPLATSHFLPIGAIIGGSTGLALGLHDTVINAKSKSIYKAEQLIKSAHRFLDGKDKLTFLANHKKLGRHFIQVDSMVLANAIVESDLDRAFCQKDKPMSYKDIKRTLVGAFKAGELISKDIEVAAQVYEENMDKEIEAKLNLAEEVAKEIEASGLGTEVDPSRVVFGIEV